MPIDIENGRRMALRAFGVGRVKPAEALTWQLPEGAHQCYDMLMLIRPVSFYLFTVITKRDLHMKDIEERAQQYARFLAAQPRPPPPVKRVPVPTATVSSSKPAIVIPSSSPTPTKATLGKRARAGEKAVATSLSALSPLSSLSPSESSSPALKKQRLGGATTDTSATSHTITTPPQPLALSPAPSTRPLVLPSEGPLSVLADTHPLHNNAVTCDECGLKPTPSSKKQKLQQRSPTASPSATLSLTSANPAPTTTSPVKTAATTAALTTSTRVTSTQEKSTQEKTNKKTPQPKALTPTTSKSVRKPVVIAPSEVSPPLDAPHSEEWNLKWGLEYDSEEEARGVAGVVDFDSDKELPDTQEEERARVQQQLRAYREMAGESDSESEGPKRTRYLPLTTHCSLL